MRQRSLVARIKTRHAAVTRSTDSRMRAQLLGVTERYDRLAKRADQEPKTILNFKLMHALVWHHVFIYRFAFRALRAA